MVCSMQASFLARYRKAVAQEQHQAAHLRDICLCTLQRADHGTVFVVIQVIGNVDESPEQLMVHDVSVPEEHFPNRHYWCLSFVH